MEMLLHIHDGAVPLLPDGFLVAQLFGKPLVAENLRMHSNHQHFLVIGTIEHADPPPFGKPAGRAPEKIMFQFFGAWLFEAEHFAAFRIDPGHDVANGAIFAGGIHALENQQQRIVVRGIVKVLQGTQLFNMLFQQFLIFLLRFVDRLHYRRPLR